MGMRLRHTNCHERCRGFRAGMSVVSSYCCTLFARHAIRSSCARALHVFVEAFGDSQPGRYGCW